MKSLSLSTPLVRTNMSRGGSPAVYMWSVKVSVVMVSGSGYLVVCDEDGLEGVDAVEPVGRRQVPVVGVGEVARVDDQLVVVDGLG